MLIYGDARFGPRKLQVHLWNIEHGNEDLGIKGKRLEKVKRFVVFQ